MFKLCISNVTVGFHKDEIISAVPHETCDFWYADYWTRKRAADWERFKDHAHKDTAFTSRVDVAAYKNRNTTPADRLARRRSSHSLYAQQHAQKGEMVLGIRSSGRASQMLENERLTQDSYGKSLVRQPVE